MTINQLMTIEEIESQLNDNVYSAELLLAHAMEHVRDLGAQLHRKTTNCEKYHGNLVEENDRLKLILAGHEAHLQRMHDVLERIVGWMEVRHMLVRDDEKAALAEKLPTEHLRLWLGEPVGYFEVYNEDSFVQIKSEYADEESVKLYCPPPLI